MGDLERAREPLSTIRPGACPSVADVEAIGASPLHPPQSEDHAGLPRADDGDGLGARARRKLVHVCHVGVQAGRPDHPRGRPRAKIEARSPRPRPSMSSPRGSATSGGRRAGPSTRPRCSAPSARVRSAPECRPVADAVARGNQKVFDEIGAEFARFVTILRSRGDDAAVESFLGRFRPGDPPEGQSLLAAAFRDYHRARQLIDPKRWLSGCSWPTSASACTSRRGSSRRSPMLSMRRSRTRSRSAAASPRRCSPVGWPASRLAARLPSLRPAARAASRRRAADRHGRADDVHSARRAHAPPRDGSHRELSGAPREARRPRGRRVHDDGGSDLGLLAARAPRTGRIWPTACI